MNIFDYQMSEFVEAARYLYKLYEKRQSVFKIPMDGPYASIIDITYSIGMARTDNCMFFKVITPMDPYPDYVCSIRKDAYENTDDVVIYDEQTWEEYKPYLIPAVISQVKNMPRKENQTS